MGNKSGYIYVLLNYSMKGLIKIGRTSKNPEERVEELSQATGVPTPFILVYMEYFNDCYMAEDQVHLALEDYRLSASREFFEMSPNKAIKLIQTLKQSEGEYNPENNNYMKSDIKNISEIGEDLYNEAEDYYYGFGDRIKDFEEAITLFDKAAKLGYYKAYRRLGKMFEYGKGVKSNEKKALQFYKEAIKHGEIKSNADLAFLFTKTPSDLFSLDNARKCWDRYFEYISEHGIENEDKVILYEYLNESTQLGNEINYSKILMIYKDEILDVIEQYIISVRENYPHMVNKLEKLKVVVQNNFVVDEDIINDFQGRVIDVFGYQGNAVLFVEIISGMITVGTNVQISKGYSTKTAIVEYIDKDGIFIHQAGAKDKNVSLVLMGEPRENYQSYLDAYVELYAEYV
ncbi:GIY-YIG nuclease family protein [Litchfieldia alkalitelluris]|uniref:GIY-YIG nuclease family protein n=1 Tax=Litchfieldia alkalitelluris TaxID=304268 RepID=UPI000998CA0C|nr:GIY-YIG nuclease family protein [Litchfieldia alkalitelluris]